MNIANNGIRLGLSRAIYAVKCLPAVAIKFSSQTAHKAAQHCILLQLPTIAHSTSVLFLF
jgi:hypothetical protein